MEKWKSYYNMWFEISEYNVQNDQLGYEIICNTSTICYKWDKGITAINVDKWWGWLSQF
jgi:hypothetical protein